MFSYYNSEILAYNVKKGRPIRVKHANASMSK